MCMQGCNHVGVACAWGEGFQKSIDPIQEFYTILNTLHADPNIVKLHSIYCLRKCSVTPCLFILTKQ